MNFYKKNRSLWKNESSVFQNQPDLEDILKLNIPDESKNKIIHFYLKIDTFFIDEIINNRIKYSNYELQYLLIQTVVLQNYFGNTSKVCYYLNILKSKNNALYLGLLDEDKSLKIYCPDYK